MSTTSTALDDDDDLDASPALPPLPAPSLPGRVADILRTPPPGPGDFGTASWGSPYPSSDHNLRRSSFGSEPSDDSPIHHLSIDTPFLRPLPGFAPSAPEPQSSVSAAAAVLANRARRRIRGLTEDWIRTHTTGIVNAEPKHWFSEGSDTDHSSLSGSALAWFDDGDVGTPRPARRDRSTPPTRPPHLRARSSIETLRPEDSLSVDAGEAADMASDETPANAPEPVAGSSLPAEPPIATPVIETPDEDEAAKDANNELTLPATPIKGLQKPLPREPPITPRIKKKVPWKGKNIMVLVPRDDQRGLPGKSPMPLRADEIEGMFASWKQLGYSVDGFDLLVEGYQPPGTDDSQSRQDWPAPADVTRERSERRYQVTLPDLNAWKEYVNELQEAKLRALGVSFAPEEPEAPSISPPTSNPSRQPSAQYPSLPFSPPIPTSSASSNHGIAGYPFPGQFIPAAQSPALPPGPSPVPFAAVPGKFNPRQSISLPPSSLPFQPPQSSPQGWPGQPGVLPGLNRIDSPSLVSLSGILSPQSPYGIEGLQQVGSPAFNIHQRHQSLQYMPPHMTARASPRLQEVIEEEGTASKSPSMTPEPTRQNPDSLQAEIDDAEYHLEEQLRHQLEHEDYNPLTQADEPAADMKPLAPLQDQDDPDTLTVAQRFASEPGKPLVLHHPRPHSRGHSLSQNFFRDHNGAQESPDEGGHNQLAALNEVPEAPKDDETQEIETNPSDLGTPVKSFEFSTAFGQHEKTLSNASNPWQDSVSAAGSARRSSHGSGPSLSKFNVDAPEFKFNPASTFTPGAFNFSSTNFQPAAPQGGSLAGPPSASSGSQFGGSARFHATAPSFSPGQSDFSFSTSGPMFRPSAPAFTPVHPLSGSLASPTGSSSSNAGKRSSIFGNIDLMAGEIVKPTKKSKAIPIVRPSSKSSAKPAGPPKPAAADSGAGEEDRFTDESRVKRARSAAPDGDDVPLFAERPDGDEDAVEASVPDVSKDEQSGAEDGSTVEGDNALPADTSMSSIVTSDHIETKAMTTTSSEASPVGEKKLNWTPFEFDNKFDAQNFSEARIFGDDGFKTTDHNKSLSATAEPFVPGDGHTGHEKAGSEQEATVGSGAYKPSSPASRLKLTPKGLGASRFASPPPPKADGLASSRFATEPSPDGPLEAQPTPSSESVIESVEQEAASPVGRLIDVGLEREPTFEEIDAVMQHLKNDPSMGVNKSTEISQRQPPTAVMEPDVSGEDLQPPVDKLARDGTSLTPRQQHVLPDPLLPMSSTELEDPFVDPPTSSRLPDVGDELEDPELQSELVSDWEGAFSEDEQYKLESRAHFFDGRVNQVVGGLLASRLEPLEKALFSIQHALAAKPRRAPSSRRDMRSVSIEFQPSDADDEDEEPVPQRSVSPRRDRRMEQIRVAVMEGLAVQQRQQPALPGAGEDNVTSAEHSAVLKALEDIRERLPATTAVRTVEQGGVDGAEPEDREAPGPGIEDKLLKKLEELQAKLAHFEDRLYLEQSKSEKEIADRRAAEDEAAELYRKLQAAETRVEVEIINRSVFDQRVADLEERLRQQEDRNEEEMKTRRAAEDRLSEVQRLLRISSEEETRLREVLDERDQRIKTFEQESGKAAMRMVLLEAAQTNSTQSQSEMTNKVNALEADLRNVRQDNNHWRSEAERADEAARLKAGELAHVLQENKHMQKLLTTLTAQLEENERLRESWRTKFMSLQDDMGRAARDIAEENARRIKKDQAMLARQEVLDARLQAEAKTRERLEVEMERLQINERAF
ncbi:hypothetical protein CDD83_8940 [Cordyceps sp. RAO-2017]|nr:hypothetical protein CDD83_8940 [Cordyceps sp. RAO-2017]